MEKVLVGVDIKRTNLWEVIHALKLVKRMKAGLSILLVDRDSEKNEKIITARKKLASLIEGGRSQGISIDYYVAGGEYKKELVNFIRENPVALLVVGKISNMEARELQGYKKMIEKIRERISCRIEIVSEKTVKN